MLFLRNILYREHFESGEESKCEEEIDLTPQDRIVIIDWCKCRCECKNQWRHLLKVSAYFLV